MEKEEIRKYLDNMRIIIQSGIPKYLPYVSKEYARFSKENTAIAMELGTMIAEQSRNERSIYAILMDKDGTLNLKSIRNISKINNVSEFIKNVENLSDQDFDFSSITSEDLINEGEEIAEKIAKQIEELDNSLDSNSDSEEIEEAGTHEDTAATFEKSIAVVEQKAGMLGKAGAAILAIIATARIKIASVINKIRTRKNKKLARDNDTRNSNRVTKNTGKSKSASENSNERKKFQPHCHQKQIMRVM